MNVAERTLDLALCAEAGPLVARCETHVLAGLLARRHPGALALSDVPATAAALREELGTAPLRADLAETTWSHAFSALETPPPEPCGPVKPSVSNKACRAAYARRWPEAPPR
ncbi:MAG: hypothetical protein H6741_10055 [Alphaproteobacteria bacterium]|nr:hypothetical protein [Alphaproteobacteria bacterium]MCB9793056.1 hypothetical protein [Alphaproteobacteria bacterium]